MATIAFTTWRVLATALLDEYNSLALNPGEFKLKSVTQPDGVTRTFNDPKDLLDAFKFADSKAKEQEDLTLRPRHRPIAIRNASIK